MLHTPWLQLVTTAPTDGSSLVLAQVNLDSAGNVKTLIAGPRQGTSLALERLSVLDFAAQSAGGTSIGASVPEIGALQPRAAGGLTIVADALGLQTSGGGETVNFDAASGHASLASLNVTEDVNVGTTLTADNATINHDATVKESSSSTG